MADQPQDIFQDVEPAADAQPVRRAVPAAPAIPVAAKPLDAGVPQVQRARWPLLVGGAVVLLVGLGAAVVLLRKSPAAPPGNTNVQNGNESTNAAAVAVNTEPARVTAPAEVITNDRDRDGLTDEEEQTLGTKAAVADTDGDGLSDADEVNVYKTNPLKPDTDGDGNADGAEVKKGYNPSGPGSLLNFEAERQKLPK